MSIELIIKNGTSDEFKLKIKCLNLEKCNLITEVSTPTQLSKEYTELPLAIFEVDSEIVWIDVGYNYHLPNTKIILKKKVRTLIITKYTGLFEFVIPSNVETILIYGAIFNFNPKSSRMSIGCCEDGNDVLTLPSMNNVNLELYNSRFNLSCFYTKIYLYESLFKDINYKNIKIYNLGWYLDYIDTFSKEDITKFYSFFINSIIPLIKNFCKEITIDKN